MEEEFWEAQIDVDDSDIILRHRSLSPTSISGEGSSLSLPCLRPCSSKSQNPNSFPPRVPQTPPRKTIPGPAGSVQAAMHRKGIKINLRDGEVAPAVEDCREEVDDGDFKLGPWLAALEFVGSDLESSMPISSIRETMERVTQLIGIVKSCAPNGLGDLYVTLKDPTDTIGASIHRRVFKEANGAGDITVGCVLILKQVVVFCPSRSACYLNVTVNNIVKVISKDCRPISLCSKQLEIGTRSAEKACPVTSTMTLDNGNMSLPSPENLVANIGHSRGGWTELAAAPSMMHKSRTTNDELRGCLDVQIVGNSSRDAPVGPLLHETLSSVMAKSVNPDNRPNEFTRESSDEVGVLDRRMVYKRNADSFPASQQPLYVDAGAPPTDITAFNLRATGVRVIQTSVSDRNNGNETADSRQSDGFPAFQSASLDPAAPPVKVPKLDLKAIDAEKVISKTSITEWTDEQLLELFSDY